MTSTGLSTHGLVLTGMDTRRTETRADRYASIFVIKLATRQSWQHEQAGRRTVRGPMQAHNTPFQSFLATLSFSYWSQSGMAFIASFMAFSTHHTCAKGQEGRCCAEWEGKSPFASGFEDP